MRIIIKYFNSCCCWHPRQQLPITIDIISFLLNPLASPPTAATTQKGTDVGFVETDSAGDNQSMVKSNGQLIFRTKR